MLNQSTICPDESGWQRVTMIKRVEIGGLLTVLLGVAAWSQGNGGAVQKAGGSQAQIVPEGTVSLTVPGKTRWLDTGVDLAMRQVIEISVHGTIQWNKDGNQMCGPTGAVPYTRWGNKAIPGINTGALIGKIGPDSTDYFYIGAGQQAVAFATGRLFVGINDDNVLDNDGAFTISIHSVKQK